MKVLILLSYLLGTLYSSSLYAKSYLIYSVAQDLPMGADEQKIKKNFYVNMGSNQGIKRGSLLSVFRVISVLDPYDNRKRINYRVKIGQLKVVHANEEAAITTAHKLDTSDELPVLEADAFMVGDHVAVSTD
jgi:hypothetical protein